MRKLLFWLCIAAAVGASFAGPLPASPPRYLAFRTDGSVAKGNVLQATGGTGPLPKLDGHELVDPKKPLRTLEDTTHPRVVLSHNYLEFHGGDRLAGRTVKYASGGEFPGDVPHLIVEPGIGLGLGTVFSRTQLRVRPEWVRRIVRRSLPVGEPVASSLAVGRTPPEPFRSFHWRESGVSALTEMGPKHCPFSDLDLLDTGPWKPWEAWQRQLAALSPTLDSPLVRLELADGTKITTSFERARPRSLGGDAPEHSYQLVQPAWSLDLLAVPQLKVRRWTIFAPWEAPLSSAEPVESRHRSVFSSAWKHAHTDENVRGEALRSDGREFVWGFGVHAEHELEFELPRSARAFRGKLALDPTAGGCARGRVRLGGKTIFESGLLLGSSRAVDVGPVALSPGGGRLALLADPALDDRPPGSEPYDIGDLCNWLEPLVEFDRVELRREVAEHYPFAHGPLAAWTADPVSAGNWRLVNRFLGPDAETAGFRLLVALDGPLTLTNEVAIDRATSQAILGLGRPGATSNKGSLEISLDSRRIHREPLPAASSPEPLRILVPLSPSSRDSIEVSVRLDPAGQPALVDWRGLTLHSAAAAR